MVQRIILTTAMLLSLASICNAGTLANGLWSPSACGIRPVPPIVEDKSADVYNQSVKEINEWQKKVNAYNACLVKEANADNDAIAKAANAEQAKFNLELEKIKKDSTVAKTKLDKL
jgi:hypothetical protein